MIKLQAMLDLGAGDDAPRRAVRAAHPELRADLDLHRNGSLAHRNEEAVSVRRHRQPAKRQPGRELEHPGRAELAQRVIYQPARCAYWPLTTLIWMV